MTAEIFNNIIYGTKTSTLIEDTIHGTITGANNWLQTNATPGPLTGSIQTASPGFRNLATKDYTLAPGSPCINAATAAVYGLPGKEYYQNEITRCQLRIRNAARDLGAFESTTANSAVGPYDPQPRPGLGVTRTNANVLLSWPLFAQDFQLEQSTVLPTISWTNPSYSFATDFTAVSATIPATPSPRFFRLRK